MRALVYGHLPETREELITPIHGPHNAGNTVQIHRKVRELWLARLYNHLVIIIFLY